MWLKSGRKLLTCFFRLQSLQKGWAGQRETPSHLCCSQKRRGPQSATASWSQRSLQGGRLKDEEGPKSTATKGAEEEKPAEVSRAPGPLSRRRTDSLASMVPALPLLALHSPEKTVRWGTSSLTVVPSGEDIRCLKVSFRALLQCPVSAATPPTLP